MFETFQCQGCGELYLKDDLEEGEDYTYFERKGTSQSVPIYNTKTEIISKSISSIDFHFKCKHCGYDNKEIKDVGLTI